MGTRSRILVYEWELEEEPQTKWSESHGRSVLRIRIGLQLMSMSRNSDLVMLSQFNGRERSVEDLRHLAAEADSRLYIHNVHRAEGTRMTIFELRLKSSAFKIDTHCHAYPPALKSGKVYVCLST